MKPADGAKHPPPLDTPLLYLLTATKLLIHILASNRYGYFRDELYFLDCARHLDWGYVDHAPLIALYAKISLLLGGSLAALRVLPAMAGAATVALAMLLARQLGGRRFAQALAGLSVLAAPIFLGMNSILTMNAFEPLFWMGCIYFLIRIVQTGNSRLWLWFGLIAGLGIQNKHSTLIFASNYGEAGAINLFGKAYGLPEAICAHQSYYLWGPPDFNGDTLIWLQWDRRGLEPLCESVEEAGKHFHPWGMAEENRPIYVCRGLRSSLKTLWPRLKNWN